MKETKMKLMKTALHEFFEIRGNKERFISFMILAFITSIVNTRLIIWVQKGFEGFLTSDISSIRLYFMIICFAMIVMIPVQMLKTKVRRNLYYRTNSFCVDKVSNQLLKLDYEKYTILGQGEVFSVINNSDSLSKLGWNFRIIIESIIGMVVICVNITMIKPVLILPTIIIYLITFLLVSIEMKKLFKHDEAQVKEKKKYNEEVSKIISGFSEIRLNATELIHRLRLRTLRRNMNEIFNDKVSSDCNIDGTIETIYSIMTITIFAYCGSLISTGSIDITMAVSLMYFSWKLLDPVINLSVVFIDNSECIANYKKYHIFMETTDPKIKSGLTEIPLFEESIKFNDVSFNYSNSETVLDKINLEIKKGEKIGICGPSGCGKTSIIRLLTRLYDVTSGSITIDGINVKDLYLGSLRSKFGVVSQDTYIFNGSILNNITYGIDCTISMQDVVNACAKANILDFIRELPDGFQTIVGENGLMLSGGQRQRIAIARVFLKNPDIILLDEATAFLDNESEKIIQESLELFKDKTIITVAHRLSTIKKSDKIVVIDDHKIVEIGTHKDLMMNYNGIYRKLVTAQSLE